MTDANPYTARFFESDLAGSYRSAKRIVPTLLGLVPARSLLDVGCGTGHFLRAFLEAGVTDVAGIDGDYVPRDQLVVDARLFRAADLAQGIDLGRRFDLVLSLEVAEHLPADAAQRFVATLVRHGSVVVFSAAVPGQGGTGHVNEQWPSYWAGLFAAQGYAAYDLLRPVIWQDEEIEFWYRQNTLIFADAAARPPHDAFALPCRFPASLDRVHPRLFNDYRAGLEQIAGRLNALNQFLAQCSRVRIERTGDGNVKVFREE